MHISAKRGDFIAENGADWAERVETLAARPLRVALLDVAGGDVVQAAVAADVLADVFVFCDLPGLTADDDGQLAFEVDALGYDGTFDGCARWQEGARWLEEEQGLHRYVVA